MEVTRGIGPESTNENWHFAPGQAPVTTAELNPAQQAAANAQMRLAQAEHPQTAQSQVAIHDRESDMKMFDVLQGQNTRLLDAANKWTADPLTSGQPLPPNLQDALGRNQQQSGMLMDRYMTGTAYQQSAQQGAPPATQPTAPPTAGNAPPPAPVPVQSAADLAKIAPGTVIQTPAGIFLWDGHSGQRVR